MGPCSGWNGVNGVNELRTTRFHLRMLIPTYTNGKYRCWLLIVIQSIFASGCHARFTTCRQSLHVSLMLWYVQKQKVWSMKKHRCTCPTLSRYPLYLRYAGTIWPSQVVRTPKIQLLSLVRLIRTLSAPPALTARQIIRSTDQTAWRVTQRKPRIDLLLPRSESCRLCLGSQGET